MLLKGLITISLDFFIKSISTFLFVICFQTCVFAQQIFPVHLNGILIPPHNLDLSVYAFDRSQDLYYVATLQDPIEAFRLVKFRLSILNNGTEIMYTDPNYNPTPVVLEKDIPMMFDGSDLAGYLDVDNLINANGQTPGFLLPEGFNGICLEVIDIERNVPISDRYCAFGYFELSDPPILNSPICNETYEISETQNIVFNWLTQHESSLNPSLGIQYEFKLVEILPDQSPYDAFDFSLPVFETTVLSPSLFYMEDAPLLESGKLYAWRIRAVDMQGNNLFSNDGYSEICTFVIKAEDKLENEDSGSYNCQNGPCLWDGELSTVPLGTQLTPGDMVQVGHFSMEITEILSFDSQSYKGEGTIYAPFLYSKIKVVFSNILVNEELRVFSGTIYSAEAENKALIPKLFDIQNLDQITGEKNQIKSGFHEDTADALYRYFLQDINGDSPPNLVSLLSGVPESNAVPITVPIGLDRLSDKEASTEIVVITGLKFDPTRASLNAVLMSRINDYNKWLKFGTKEFCFQPGGLPQAGAAELDLLTDTDVDLLEFGVTFHGFISEEKGSYLTWDCNGFDEFSLFGKYSYDENTFQNLSKPSKYLLESFTLSTEDLSELTISVGPESKKSELSSSAAENVLDSDSGILYNEAPWYDGFMIDDLRNGSYYARLPEYAERAAELVGRKSFMYDLILGLKYELEGYILLATESDKRKDEIDESKVNESIKKFKKALSLYDENALNFLLLSKAYGIIGKTDSAYYYARQSVKYSPTWGKSYRQVANVYLQNGQLSLAKKWAEKAIERDSTNYSFYSDRALPAFAQAFRETMESGSRWKINSYTFSDKIPIDEIAFEDMLQWYVRSIQISPNLDALHKMGWAFSLAGQYDQAELLFNQALDFAPHELDIYKKLILIFGKTKQYSKLEQLIERMNTINNAGTIIQFNEVLALAYLLMEDYGNFDRQYINFDQRQKSNANLNYEICRIMAINEQANRAIEYLEKAIENGFSDKNDLAGNPDLKNIRDLETFGNILENLESEQK